jgi:hypothetical protein
MAINQNHLSEELNGVKCAIVEKNATRSRADFLERILVYNHYSVVMAASPPPKPLPAKPAPAAGLEPVAEIPVQAPAAPETFTVGVTDLTFNPINAIFGRLLKAPGGHIVTLGYWHQKENEPRDDTPYFDAE